LGTVAWPHAVSLEEDHMALSPSPQSQENALSSAAPSTVRLTRRVPRLRVVLALAMLGALAVMSGAAILASADSSDAFRGPHVITAREYRAATKAAVRPHGAAGARKASGAKSDPNDPNC
jgi:hypothetical protein